VQVSGNRDDAPHSVPEPEDWADITERLYLAWRQLRRGSVRKLVAATYEGGGIPLEPSQADVVEFVALRDGARMVDIANAMRIAQPTATRVVQRLIDRGLLERERSADDGRAVVIRPTELGRQECERFRTMRRALLDSILTDLSATEIAAGAQFIERLVDGIDRAATQIARVRPSQ
jgi:DNA-binding MarR family transcriptional regulator